MKHILFYTDTPNFGGAEKHMMLLAKHLRKAKVQVSLAYGSYSKLAERGGELDECFDQVFQISTLHKHDPRHYWGLRKILSRQKFDLVHLHLWNPGSCRYAFFAAEKGGVPVVTTEHDPFELSGLKKVIKKQCIKKTKRIITVSSDNFRRVGEWFDISKEWLRLVHNGIELDKFMDNHDKARLPVQEGTEVILCIAELHPRKGHRYLLEAFKKTQIHWPQLNLVLVGQGPAERELKEQAADIPNVHFLGWREDVPQIIKAADILVLPSLKEAFGQVLLEAMASGVAVISTNNGGTVDIIQDGVTGYLIPPANSEVLNQKILTLLYNQSQKKDMEKAALASVKNNFTAKKMADATVAVYKEVW